MSKVLATSARVHRLRAALRRAGAVLALALVVPMACDRWADAESDPAPHRDAVGAVVCGFMASGGGHAVVCARRSFTLDVAP